MLTPEELDDAERLKKLSAKFGTDPTAIVGRFQLSSQYVELPQGGQVIENLVRLDLPFKETGCSGSISRSCGGAILIVQVPGAHRD